MLIVLCCFLIFSGTFWGALAEEFASVDPPTGFQGFNKSTNI